MSAEPKLTAEQLIEIVDAAGEEMLAAFIPAYREAARKVLKAVVRAQKEGMDADIVVIGLARFLKVMDRTAECVEVELGKIAKEEEGLEP